MPARVWLFAIQPRPFPQVSGASSFPTEGAGMLPLLITLAAVGGIALTVGVATVWWIMWMIARTGRGEFE